ncbi:hypothetical protein BASA81_015842 [Batrachochytrium salamandrivorans]|nr:hypothetical protein BASA81_015842 [Batrachochytrium salamandrivorans]
MCAPSTLRTSCRAMVRPCCPPSPSIGDSVLVNRTFNLPQRVSRLLSPIIDTELHTGDLVISRSPVDPNSMVLKRIAELYTDAGSTLPTHHVRLLGDNPEFSRDSREYGSIPVAMIEGRVWMRVWPLSKFGRL